MPRTKYFFNPKSLSFEKVSENRRYMLWRTLGISSLIIVSVVVLSLIFSQVLSEPITKQLEQQSKTTKLLLKQMENQLNVLNDELIELQQKDREIYRAIYGVEAPKTDNKNINDYSDLLKLPFGEAMARIRSKMDEIKHLNEVQKQSYATLEDLISKQSDLVNSIPAIMPVANKDLKRMASGFGYRLDPFYHTSTFHAGMDFTAEVGTEVYATGDGRVAAVKKARWGYGNHIIINHGHGYTTLYGHLSRFNIRPGETVKRGQLIGFVGNTGRSTGPHLHYEVRKNNNPLNPAFFYRNDLTDEQYQIMLENSQREANRFD